MEIHVDLRLHQSIALLSLDYNNRLSKVLVVEMCIQGMHWGILYILQGIWPHIFEELATWAYDIKYKLNFN